MFCLEVNNELKLALGEVRFAKEVFALVKENYKHIYEWMDWCNENCTVESIEAFYKIHLQKFANNDDAFALIIVFKGKIVGGTGLHNIDRHNKSAEIGYWLAEEFTGKGIVTKSVTRLLEYAFNELKLNRISIKCVPENIKSRAIPERLKFIEERIERQVSWLHTRFVDHVVYSMLKEEWGEKV